jgi:hypothetical protein
MSGAALKIAAVIALAGGLLAVGFAARRSAVPESVVTPSASSRAAPDVDAPRSDEGPPVVSWEDLPRSRGDARGAANALARSRSAAPPLAPELASELTDTPPVESDPAAQAPATTSAPSEGALLLKARQQLAADPSAALALTDEAGKRFPDGPLSYEREVLAIEALAHLGRLPAARARLAAFRARYPQSPHLARLESLVHP